MVILLWAHPKCHIVASIFYSIQIVMIYLFLMEYVCHKCELFCSTLPRWHSAKESACQRRRRKRPEFDPQVGKILWSRKWQLVSVFLLRKSMDRGVWKAKVHGVTKSQTWLSKHSTSCLYWWLSILGTTKEFTS